MNFIQQLKEANRNFNVKAALELSDKLHEFEGVGGQLSREEDSLWYALTDKIETARLIGRK